MTGIRTSFVSLVVLFLGATSVGATPADSAAGAVEGDTIAWYRGDVEQAFDIARSENKPLFFYWGAVWCPPCQQIKNTVFKSRQFIALSELFVPLYLDGDTEEAQAAGERFGVKGYPTMIVFSPAGEEITRIPGGIDIARYNSVLRLSLNQMRPTRELLRMAMSDASALGPEDFTQLAYYSWGQDKDVLPEESKPTLFRDLAKKARPHDNAASARLFMQYLVSSSQEDSEEAPVQIGDATGRLEEILASDELVLACWDSLAYYPEIVEILQLDDGRGEQLQHLWQDRLMTMRHDASLSTEEQLAGWLPLLYFHFEETEDPLSDAVAKALEEDVKRADERTTNPYARQSVINQVKWVYTYAHMQDKARKVLLSELETSRAPWYFMSSLASLAEDEGKSEEAIEWYRKAYENSQGPATRFQWGASYVRALVRLTPENDELILSTAELLFKDLPSANEAFSGRNFRVLRRLNDSLVEWKKDETREALDTRFVSHIEMLCAAEKDGSVEKENCSSLVEGESTG